MMTSKSRRRAVCAALALLVAVTGSLPLAGAQGSAPEPPATPHEGKPNVTQRLAAAADAAAAGGSAVAQATAAGLASDGPGSLLRRADGDLLVELRLSDASDGVVDQLRRRGAEIVDVSAETSIVTIEAAPTAIRAIAAHPSVIYASEILTPAVGGAGGSAGGEGPVTSGSGDCPTGILSEGDAQLSADDARLAEGVDGTGVRVGVLSDTYNALLGADTDITNAELPGATNPCGNTTPVVVQADLASGTDEGRAMAQIVHDLAPGAEIAYATAFSGENNFATQVTNLVAGGADVIVDDVSYFSEPIYQDGVIAKAMADAVANGVPVFSSAGNQHRVIGGNEVGSYEAPAYRPTTCPTGVPAYAESCHDFDPGVGATGYNTFTVPAGGRMTIILGYNQPKFGVTADFDLYLVNEATGAALKQSENDNAAAGSTYEFIDHTNNTGTTQTLRLVMARYNGSPLETPRFKLIHYRLSGVTAVAFNTSTGGDVFGPTLYGHHAQASVAGVGAVPYYNANAIESFSSRGPAEVCWGPVVGSTPATALSPCVASTIAFAATDGGQNSFFGSFSDPVWRFYGTSAAAPHAAAVAALLREAEPCRTPAELLAAMQAGAVPLAGYDVDDQGAGRVDAVGAFANLAACPAPAPTVTSVSPNAGVTTGGQTVTITGYDFTDATDVRFGPTDAASFTIVNDTTITAVTPARPAGLVNVWVENAHGTSGNSASSWYNFQNAPTSPPVVTSLTPNIGTVDGGTAVTIKGTGFLTASSVRFGPTQQATFTVVNDTTIYATAPAHSAALVNVWVTNPIGTNTNGWSSWYEYRVITGPPPSVTSISPNVGPTSGGQSVTITGVGFTDVSQVRFGPTAAASFVVVNDTTITAVTPARPAALVNVWVTNQNGSNPNGITSWYRFE